jgi:hypothetical protein
MSLRLTRWQVFRRVLPFPTDPKYEWPRAGGFRGAHLHAALSEQGALQDPSSQANYPVFLSVTAARRQLEAPYASALSCARKYYQPQVAPPDCQGSNRPRLRNSTTLRFLVEALEDEGLDSR